MSDISEKEPDVVTQSSDFGDVLSQNGISQAPFSQPNDSESFYFDDDRRALLDQTLHLCQFGNNLVVLTGNTGVGKTAFLQQTHLELQETATACLISAGVLMSAEDVFSQIARQLDFPLNTDELGAGELISLLRQTIAEEEMNRVVFIIDDAHHLDDQTLFALVSLLQGQRQNHLHLLMSGDQTLPDRFDQFELVDILVYDLTLEPFTKNDIPDYIAFRLDAAGYESEDLLDKATLNQLWQDSQGYPSALNQAAQSLLFDQEMTPDLELEEKNSLGLPLFHMAGLVILLAALILALFYLGDDSETVDSENINTTNSTIDDPITESTTETIEPVPSTEATPTVSPVLSLDTPEPSTTDSAATQPTTQNQENPSSQVSNTAENTDAISSEKNASATETSISEPQKTEVTPDTSNNNEVITQSPTTTETESTPDKPSTTKTGPQSTTSQTNSSAQQTVLNWPDNHFALQVIGASNREALVDFIAKQPNQNQLKLVTVTRNSQPWHIVVIGSYPNNEAARQAILRLPQSQINSSPWPRKVNELKQQIRATSP